MEGVATFIAEVAGSRNAVRRGSGSGICADGARNGEGTEIDEVIGIVGAVLDGSNHIGTVEAVSAAAVVALEVVVELEGLTILEREDTVNAPTVFQLLQIAARLRKFIAEIPGEAMRNVEVRRTVFQVRTVAVVGLRGVGLEIFAVAGVVHGT